MAAVAMRNLQLHSSPVTSDSAVRTQHRISLGRRSTGTPGVSPTVSAPLRRVSSAAPRVTCRLKDWRAPNSDGASGGALLRRRLENAWSVQQQPVPVACESCRAEGVRECEWCNGSGYFTLGDKMLCEVPSRNTTCIICHGQGSVRCSDCLGTGFRARWLETLLEKK